MDKKLIKENHRIKYNKVHNRYIQEMRDTAKDIGNCSRCFKPKENIKFGKKKNLIN